MDHLTTIDTSIGPVEVATTERRDGDLSMSASDPLELSARRRSILDLQWAVVRQVHSDRVREVAANGRPEGVAAPDRTVADDDIVAGVGDAIVTARTDLVIAAHSADCATVALVGENGEIGVVHAGWRGLQRGIVEASVRRLRQLHSAATSPLKAVIGPHICPGCYEFGEPERTQLAAQFGDAVTARSRTGSAALDLEGIVLCELERLNVELVASARRCTSCQATDFWSYRARQESGRTALMVWHAGPTGSRVTR